MVTQHDDAAPPAVLASNFSYNYPFTGPMSFNYGDGTWSYQSRDQDYRPWVRLDGPYLKYYIHDPAGNITNLNDVNNTVLTYAYDATGRLVSAIDSASNGFGSLGYSYDKNGNRTVEIRNASNLSYAYSPPGSNWLYQRGSDTRVKSPNGNTVSSAAGSFAYDGYNRLVTAQTAAETTTYTYNALGQRIRKINQNGLATSFHYGASGELLYEQDQAGNTKAYVWLDGRPLARIDNNAQIYYYHVDHLGTPQAMTDAAGTVVWKGYYDPFGRATVRVSTIENNLRLPGQYYDRETGMHYNYFRDYDPTTGRYIEFDLIGLRGGLNGYLYGQANPLSNVDPLGLYGTLDFVQHYYDGGGQAVDLGAVGLLGTFQNSPFVGSSVSQFGNELEAKVAQKAKSTCGNCGSGSKTIPFNFSDKAITDVTNVPDLYAVGHSTFFRKARCTVTVNCTAHTFSYSCSEDFSIRDKFADPLRARETFGKEMEVGGTPYPINANFGGSVSGSGSF